MTTDRTAAALASALPEGSFYEVDLAGHGMTGWSAAEIAAFQAERLAEALALIHDHVEAGDE